MAGAVRRRRAAVAGVGALGAAVALALAGCELLGPSLDDGFGDALATYGTGTATMTIGGDTIRLDQIAPGPHVTRGLGASVYWFNDEGWGLRLTGGGSDAFGVPAMVAIDRVRTTYWSAGDFGQPCTVRLTEMDATGLRGSATCTGLRWTDMLHDRWGPGLEEPPYVEGEAPFDATIEFEALPKPPAT